MTIRAPYQVLYSTPFKADSFQREVFLETLGACWALSSRNVSGAFAIQLQIDLSRIQLLYGIPSQHLPEPLFFQLLNVFQARPRAGFPAHQADLEHNALELVESMSEADFLNFSTGFQDAVCQILEPLDCWDQECRQANLALKYYGLNLLESSKREFKVKRTYSDLLVNYLLTTQGAYLRQINTSTYNF